MTDTQLRTRLSDKELFHLDLLEQGGLVKKSIDPESDGQYWEITWKGYEFLDAVRSEGVWEKLKQHAEERGIGITVDVAIRTVKELIGTVL